ncbi:hypothetical protein FO519_003318 [Halicephalobus sp. NKZ332]|nr:hypothetical protein FO519_003318 [Halicephalobus sp. NKZ332]
MTVFSENTVPRDPSKVPIINESNRMTTFDSYPDRLRHRLKIRNELVRNALCEFVCTTVLIFGGDSIVACSVLKKGFNEWIGITVGWGLALIVSAQLGFRTSGAHMNPAVSLFVFTFGQLKLLHMFVYWAVQVLGGFCGAALVYLMYHDAINEFDGGTRFVTGVRKTAGIFSTYPQDYLSIGGGVVDQILGTAMLCFFVAMITDKRNKIPAWAQPTLLGLMLMLVGMAWGMNAGYAVNPARDLGPRIFTFVAGYGSKVFSYRGYKWFLVPVLCPLLGGVLGAWSYQLLIGLHIPSELDEIEEEFRRLQKDKLHQTVTLQENETPQSSTHQNVHSRVYRETPMIEIFGTVVGLFLALYAGLYFYFLQYHSYWKKKGVPVPEGWEFFWGHFKYLVRDDYLNVRQLMEWSKKFPGYFGLLKGHNNVLVVSDPEMAMEVLVKKFEHFHGREMHPMQDTPEENPERVNIINARGLHWKRLRTISNPIFSVSNMKKIMPTIVDTVDNVLDYLKTVTDKPLDIHKVFQELTMDVIYLFLEAEVDDQVFEDGTFDKKNLKIAKELNINEIVGQCFIFLLAGYDTTANSLSFLCFELINNPESLEKLNEEIQEFTFSENFTYENISQLRYLDACIKESLRLHPIAASVVTRTCMEPTTIGNIFVEKGINVEIDVLSLNFSEKLWGPDPEKFRPERWLESEHRNQAAFMTFGAGPRICLGKRLAIFEEKIMLIKLLQKFDLKKCEKSEKELFVRGYNVFFPASVTVKLEPKE